MSSEKEILDALHPWVNWQDIAKRVRKSSSDETAIYMMKRHFRHAIAGREASTERERAREEQQRPEREAWERRVADMAKAMAETANEPDKYLEFIGEAAILDAALVVRKKHEV